MKCAKCEEEVLTLDSSGRCYRCLCEENGVGIGLKAPSEKRRERKLNKINIDDALIGNVAVELFVFLLYIFIFTEYTRYIPEISLFGLETVLPSLVVMFIKFSLTFVCLIIVLAPVCSMLDYIISKINLYDMFKWAHTVAKLIAWLLGILLGYLFTVNEYGKITSIILIISTSVIFSLPYILMYLVTYKKLKENIDKKYEDEIYCKMYDKQVHNKLFEDEELKVEEIFYKSIADSISFIIEDIKDLKNYNYAINYDRGHIYYSSEVNKLHLTDDERYKLVINISNNIDEYKDRLNKALSKFEKLKLSYNKLYRAYESYGVLSDFMFNFINHMRDLNGLEAKLTEFDIYNTIICNIERFKEEYRVIRDKKESEKTVNDILYMYKNMIYNLSNISLNIGNVIINVDNILVTSRGIFVVDIVTIGLNYEEVLKIERDGRWSKVFYNENTELMDEPINIARNAASLSSYINKKLHKNMSNYVDVKGIAVVCNDNVSIHNESSHFVVRPHEIYNIIMQYPVIFTEKEMLEIKDIILQGRMNNIKYDMENYTVLCVENMVKLIEIYEDMSMNNELIDKLEKLSSEIETKSI